MRINDIGRRNGIVRFWLNGRLTHEYTNLNIEMRRVRGRSLLQFTLVWGGVGGTRTRSDEWLIDDFYIAGRPK